MAALYEAARNALTGMMGGGKSEFFVYRINGNYQKKYQRYLLYLPPLKTQQPFIKRRHPFVDAFYLGSESKRTSVSITADSPLIIVSRHPADDLNLVQSIREKGLPTILTGEPKRVFGLKLDKPAFWKPGMFLVDMILSGESGFDFVKRLRQQYADPNIPIVMVSSHDPREDVADAFNHGVNLIIRRPLTLDKIRHLLLKQKRWHNPSASYRHVLERTQSAVGW